MKGSKEAGKSGCSKGQGDWLVPSPIWKADQAGIDY